MESFRDPYAAPQAALAESAPPRPPRAPVLLVANATCLCLLVLFALALAWVRISQWSPPGLVISLAQLTIAAAFAVAPYVGGYLAASEASRILVRVSMLVNGVLCGLVLEFVAYSQG